MPLHGSMTPSASDLSGSEMMRSGFDFQFEAETGAGGAGTVGGVEGEGARLDLVEFERVPVRAAAVFGERLAAGRAAFLLVHEVDDDAAVGELEGGFHRVGQALADARP